MKSLWVSGEDAQDFLNRVTAGRVKGLAQGQGAGGILLNGQSRMIAQFDLLRMDEKAFLLVSDKNCFEALQLGLERLHFSENLFFKLGKDYGLERSLEVQKRPEIFSTGESWPSPVPGYKVVEGDQPLPPLWHFDRIGALVPGSTDWDSSTPALEAGMLQWIDRNKGCYPGQEAVERSINVGHPAKVLIACEGFEKTVSQRLPLPEGGEGLVTSSAEFEGKTRIFLRVPWAKREKPPTGFRLLTA